MITVDSANSLSDLLRSGPRRVRLTGAGSRSARLFPAPKDAQVVSLGGLNRIERLERDDLTCSVEPGVRCSDLAESLAAQGLELGFDIQQDPGTIGGLFATDPMGPANVGAPSPRSILLGVEAMLSNGAPFRSGARVVKSVAGFDVHRLLVGSEGRLFAAVLLHLKLRSRPQATAAFTSKPEDFPAALRRFMTLRSLAPTLQRLMLQRTTSGYTVEGRCSGRTSFVSRTIREHQLDEAEHMSADHLAAEGPEVIAGILRPGRLAKLHELLPEQAPFLVHGGGHFEAVLKATETDHLFAALDQLGARACVVSGSRRGHNSTVAPGEQRLTAALQRQLDPLEVFA